MCTMSTYRIEQLEVCHREMFGDLVLTCPTPTQGGLPKKIIQPVTYPLELRRSSADSVVKKSIIENEKRRASALVDELLIDIYYSLHNATTDYNSATSGKSHKNSWVEVVNLQEKDVVELGCILNCLRTHIERMGSVLVRQLKRRDALRRQQEAYCDVITNQLAKRAPEGTTMRFTIQPAPGESGFSQWAAAMKMVAQLPGGIPPEFRSRLWLNLAERHLASRGVDWPSVERSCFSEWSHPADSELGVQIVKDLHRTGCSLFCGEDGQENQALLKRVLLAYARWNKAVGYCQGFNMLAALILQVTDKCESDALKLMIYLIEGVLPDSYFADSLRGLSVDMAVFRELLRSRLPRLSKHLDTLQNAAKDGSRSYEPPLTNVFTMQWFLTLFCNCLPQPTVLRVWDLILLEGNEILLRTALAIWQVLADRILSVRSADEFYCIMGVLTRELLEFGLVDGNSLIKAVVTIGPLTELKTLRDHYLYNINPWGPSLPHAVVEKQLKLYPKQSLALDISALKKQYSKLKQRQRQAHIIFSAAISRQPSPTAPVTMNHLLLGKSALVPAKRIGPPKGTIPPARQVPPSTLYWKDAPKQTSSSSSSDTELCDAESEDSSNEEEPTQKGQFNDNLPCDSDNILMKNDNITSVKTSASEPENNLKVETDLIEIDLERSITPLSQKLVTEHPKISEISDTFDTASIDVKVLSESDDENFDFERFLADRVKCLKESSLEEEEPDERINYARRNSTRALQIIQENSLILHRILQCQSRLSPSPPLVDDSAEALPNLEDTITSPSHCHNFELLNENIDFKSATAEAAIPTPYERHEIQASNDNQESHPIKQTRSKYELQIDCIEELKSPEYGSKYTSILEKSKSLDERYNALILNIPSIKQSVSEERCITKICEEKSILSGSTKGGNLRPNFVSSFSFEESSGVTEKDILKLNKHNADNIEINKESGSSFGEYDVLANRFKKDELHFTDNGDTKSPESIENMSARGNTRFEKFQYYFPNEGKEENSTTNSDSDKLSSYLQEDRIPTYTIDLTSSLFDFNRFTINDIDNPDSATKFLDNSIPTNKLSPVKSPKYPLSDLSDSKSKESGIYSTGDDSINMSNANLSPIKSPKYPLSDFSDYKTYSACDDFLSMSYTNLSPLKSPKHLPELSDCKFTSDVSILNTNLSPKNIHLSPLKSPKYTLPDFSDYKSKESKLYFTFDNPVGVSNKYIHSIREENSLIENSESDSKTCWDYQPPPTDKQYDIIPKDNSLGNLYLEESQESIERISPTENKYSISHSRSELKITSTGQSTKFDDIKEEPSKKSLTLDVGAYGESSNSKSPLKSPLKSPSKAFNPFPVPLSSRQSKEVQLKLGLYKK